MFLAIAPAHNTTKPDATGAFQPEAQRFLKYHKVTGKPYLFDNSRPLPARRGEVDDLLDAHAGAGLECLAFFCHGTKHGLQTGHEMGHGLFLGQRIARTLSPGAVVCLYACDAGRDSDMDSKDDVRQGPGGADGFASVVYRGILSVLPGVTLVAHATAGHTTQNPWARVWRDDTDPGSGDWFVEPHTKLWSTWCKALRLTSYRYRFPFLTEEELAADLPKLSVSTGK